MIYEELREALRAEEPVVLATVIEGPPDRLGAKLLVRPGGGQPNGTLGDPELDRVVARDALGELASGITTTRHYGLQGEAPRAPGRGAGRNARRRRSRPRRGP